MKRAAGVLAILFFCLLAPAHAAPSDMIHQLDWLVGKTWSADTTGMPGKTAHIDVRYEWAATGNFVQFNTKFVERDGSVTRRYAGNFFYDPAKNGLAMWYMDQDNAIVQAPVQIDGDRMTMTFSQGGDAYQVTVTRQNPSLYQWTLFAQVGGAWKQVLTLAYARVQ